MPAIPLVNIEIPLSDTGYNFRFTEADTSTTLGQFGFQNPQEQPVGQGGTNQTYAAAFFPGYNTLGSPMTPTPENFTLQAHTKTGHASGGTLPTFNLFGFDGINFLQVTWNSATGVIQAKLTTWPAAIDYSTAGMVSLDITNVPSLFTSLGGISPVTFADASKGFVIWSMNNRGGGASNELLPVTLDLSAATTWVQDPRPLTIDPNPTTSFPLASLNFMATLVNAPTLEIFENIYDLSGGTMTVSQTLAFSGDISTDAQNAFLPNNDSGFYYTPIGIFGIDWNSGNFTGCWYCNYSCTAYGNVTFPMPDASLGPSSNPAVFWVNNFFNNLPPDAAATVFQFYPNWDTSGAVWWIRVPLVDGGGNYVLEPLTGEVYTQLPAPAGGGKFFGTFVGVARGGQASGGTK